MSNFFEKSKRGRGRAKHAILDQYLKAFFAIQCQCKTWNDPILYIDGFAGPGTYVSADENANEEIGSPIVAYKAASEHSLIDNFRRLGNKILLIFVEKDKEKSKRLQRKLQELERETEDSVKEIGKNKCYFLNLLSFRCKNDNSDVLYLVFTCAVHVHWRYIGLLNSLTTMNVMKVQDFLPMNFRLHY